MNFDLEKTESLLLKCVELKESGAIESKVINIRIKLLKSSLVTLKRARKEDIAQANLYNIPLQEYLTLLEWNRDKQNEALLRDYLKENN